MKYFRKMRREQSGFSAIEVIIVVLVIAVLVGAGMFFLSRRHKNEADKQNQSSQSENRQGNTSTNSQNEPDLVVYNFGVANLDSINITKDATRDFTASGHKGFYVFGDILPGTPVRHNPNYEFASVKEGTQLIAAIDGVVGFIKQQPESNDYEVFLMPNEQSNWIIGYDHVTDVKVQKGDKVKVGDVIGGPARQNNGLLRYEFQINKNKNGGDGMHICPSTLLAADVREQQLAQLKTMQDSWESVSGLELYDTAKQQPIGCIEKEMTPAYANGQN